MRALTINGEPWRVIRVPVGDPRLIDRTGEARLATTNPKDKTICIRDDIMQLVEDHSIEAIDAASEILGRPVCVRGRCA